LEIIEKSIKFLEEKTDILAILDTKAEILNNLGDFKNAFELFQKILKVDKNDLRVRKFYAETCWKASKAAREIGLRAEYERLENLAKQLVDTHCSSENVKKEIKEHL